jgi:hypothetical protein
MEGPGQRLTNECLSALCRAALCFVVLCLADNPSMP